MFDREGREKGFCRGDVIVCNDRITGLFVGNRSRLKFAETLSPPGSSFTRPIYGEASTTDRGDTPTCALMNKLPSALYLILNSRGAIVGNHMRNWGFGSLEVIIDIDHVDLCLWPKLPEELSAKNSIFIIGKPQ